jgi:hypothetical protein
MIGCQCGLLDLIVAIKTGNHLFLLPFWSFLVFLETGNGGDGGN